MERDWALSDGNDHYRNRDGKASLREQINQTVNGIFITLHVVSLLFAAYSSQPSVNIVLANIKTNMQFFFLSHCTSASAPCSQVRCQHFPALEECCVDTGP